jgi:hypothetical protein
MSKKMTLKNKNVIRDAINCASYRPYEEDINCLYGKGVIHGMVSAIMAVTGLSYKEALKVVFDNQPKRWVYKTRGFNPSCMPDAWRDDWQILKDGGKL